MKLCSGKNRNIVQDANSLHVCGLTTYTVLAVASFSSYSFTNVLPAFFVKNIKKSFFLNNNPAYPLCSPRSTPSFGFVVVVDVCLFPFSLWFGSPSRGIPSCHYCLQLGETRVETEDRRVLVCGSLLSRHFSSSSFLCVSLQPFSLRSQCLQ